jgi:hypothetical protein
MVWGTIYEPFVISPDCPAGQYDNVTGRPCVSPRPCAGATGGTGGTGCPTPPIPRPPEPSYRICSDALVESTIRSQSAFDSWKSSMSAKINEAKTVGDVEELETQITSYEKCLQSQLSTLQTSSTTVSLRQGSVSSISKQIEEAKKDLAIAKDRVLSVKHPERISSYYESWFPIYRPFKENTIPLLIGISLFMFLVAILLIFSYVGISFNLFVPVPGGGQQGSSGMGFNFVLGLAVIFFALMLYAFLGR